MTSSATLPSPVVIPHEVGSETDLNTTGPIFVGLILNWCLLGCLVVQVYIYYLSSRGDRAGLKFLVCFVSILDMAQTGVATEYAWRLLVVYNHPFDEPDDPEVSIYLPMINGIISAAVQVFFAWRIWSLNRALAGRVAAIFISLIALMQALSCIIAPNIPVDPLPDSGGPIYLVTLLWLVSNVVGDILIAAFMLYTLRKARCQSLSQGVETILSRLMVNTIETGVITAIVASLGLVLFLLGTGYDQPIIFILGKLFSNVCLANLNARSRTQRLGDNVSSFSTTQTGGGRGVPTLHFAAQSTNASQSRVDPGEDTEVGITHA